MKRILSVIMATALVVAATALTACKNNEEQNSFVGWETDRRETVDGETLQNYAQFRIATTDNTRKVRTVWVNIFGLEEETAEISVAFFNSQQTLSPNETKYVVNKADLKENDGWVKLVEYAEGEELNYTYVEFTVTDAMVFNEIGLENDKGTALSVSLVKCGERPDRESNSKNEMTESELKDKVDNEEITSSPLNLIDEQDKFKELLKNN